MLYFNMMVVHWVMHVMLLVVRVMMYGYMDHFHLLAVMVHWYVHRNMDRIVYNL